jgi:predicted ATP-grasp superfamily ATP-dependent carboligase
MLNAFLQDLASASQIDVVTLLHKSFANIPPGEIHRIADAREEHRRFHDLAAGADATLVIAPESSGILLERCQWVENAGGRLLGPSPAAVALTSDKLRLSQTWFDLGVPTLPTYLADTKREFPAVLKPRDGAGSQATFLVHNASEREKALREACAAGLDGNLLAQPFIAGVAASIAFLVGKVQTLPLLPAAQHLSDDGRFRYLGGAIPLDPALAKRALALGWQAIAAVDGLRGYVGVDLVLSEAGDFAIEINPRLTTSYIGLRTLCENNLAHAMLRVALGQPIEELRWRQAAVRFRANGKVENWPRP